MDHFYPRARGRGGRGGNTWSLTALPGRRKAARPAAARRRAADCPAGDARRRRRLRLMVVWQRWARAMSDNSLPPAIRTGERHGRWISWMTLVAGAVLCVVAVLLS